MSKNLITRLNYVALRNEVHVEYNNTFCTLVKKYTPAALDITALYDAYKPLFDDEVSALDIVRKSELTAEIHEQDSVRDGIFRGLADAVKSALNHFDADKRTAAQKLQVVFENYGNISAKTLDQETAAIQDLLRELNSPSHAPSVNLLALGDWASHLEIENNKFEQLMLERYTETSERPTVRMRDARLKTDRMLRTILDRIEALILINGSDAYESFVRELNAVTERYKHILAQNKGERKPKE
jgi:hypothetical protein